jgi:hypothetical protein
MSTPVNEPVNQSVNQIVNEKKTSRAIRSLARAVIGTTASLVVLGGFGAGCLSRPVTTEPPTTKDNYTQDIRQSAIDKVDLLFDIDNSASMGDKQEYLSKAVPDLLNRLVSPYCVDASGNPIKNGTTIVTSDINGNCPAGQGNAEFKPVHDMHIGVVTSSLGTRGPTGSSAICDPSTGADNDTKGELIARGSTASPVMAPSNFLTWLPNASNLNAGLSPVPGATAIQTADNLETDFADLVTSTGQAGCGIESQLESWYRFLIQPDPYDSITVSGTTASWSGVDTTILKQRHDFLRPDSLVAIITLTDENDSEVDVRSVSGTGWNFMSSTFDPPRGTSQCDTNPGDPNCTSCGFPSTPQTDPNCQKGNYSANNDWGFNANLRHVHTKAKYGVDYQFPIERYVKGLTNTKIPDRNGEYPSGAGNYVGNADCTNPLYAASLPDGSSTDTQSLCNLTVGFQRTPDLVFFGIIGGVPNQLLHYDGTDASLTLTPADWTKILGNNPETYDYTGIDPHMIEAYSPRAGLASATGSNTADPINGREWITDTANADTTFGMPFPVDREYACIFPLTTARDCTQSANSQACDCPADATKAAGLPAGAIPPVCDATNPTSQVAAKVYPTPRELLLAHKMGDQGIAASLCPIDVTEKTPGDPLYGYRPAVAAIVSRLKNALASACLPQALTPDANGNVPCLILEALPPGTPGGCATQGLEDADPKQAAVYQASLNAESGSGDGGAATVYTICQVPQLIGATDDPGGTCVGTDKAGWCYVTGANAGGGCAQAIKFSQKGNPTNGARVTLQCIQQTGGNADGGTATTTTTGDGG